MPEEKEAQKPQEKPQEAAAAPDASAAAETPKKIEGLMQWLIPGAIFLVMVVAGFVVGRMLGNKGGPAQAKAATKEKSPENKTDDLLIENSSETKGWYYDLEPVATNLNEPGATRYVRVLLTLEMLPQVDQVKGTEFLNGRKPIMINLLNIYFAGLSIEDLNSDKDIRRIQTELVDIFNENLYLNSKPLIKKILFKEFGIQ